MNIPVAICGATGLVGQNFIALLHEHPWFTVEGLYASRAYPEFPPHWHAVFARPDDFLAGRPVHPLVVEKIIMI